MGRPFFNRLESIWELIECKPGSHAVKREFNALLNARRGFAAGALPACLTE